MNQRRKLYQLIGDAMIFIILCVLFVIMPMVMLFFIGQRKGEYEKMKPATIIGLALFSLLVNCMYWYVVIGWLSGSLPK